jgi:hypothetical protein
MPKNPIWAESLVLFQFSRTLDDKFLDFRLHTLVFSAARRLEAPVQAGRYINTQAARRFRRFFICGFLVPHIWGKVGLFICGYGLALVLPYAAALESLYYVRR